MRLQLATSTPKDPADDMEVLRAELDGMEHGGKDADEAHMYALPVLSSNPLTYWPKHMLLTCQAHQKPIRSLQRSSRMAPSITPM